MSRRIINGGEEWAPVSEVGYTFELNGELVARMVELSGRNGRYRALLIRIANALGDSDYRQIAAEINKALADAGT